MKFIYVSLLLWAVSVSGLSAQKTRKAIFVIADGIPAHVIERLKPPALASISDGGGYAMGGEKEIMAGNDQQF